MSVKVMAVNAGSSSLKFKLYLMPEEKVICKGIADRIGHDDGIFEIKHDNGSKRVITPLPDHAVAVELLLQNLISEKIISSLDEISGVGHRIVQGGSYFSGSVLFDDDAEAKIESLIPLAPLHNAAHLIGFRAFKKVLPNVKNVAVFDTAFHQTMEPQDYLFPIPYEYYEKYATRRYGAHGTSHLYLSLKAKEYYSKEKGNKLITCHLGSGASISAILDGKCVATSMGLTPLGGIMMGTRCGDMDPSVFQYVAKCTGMSVEETYQTFNKKSGLLGVSGVSNDSRDVFKGVEEGNKRCVLANEMFVRRVCDFIGQYYVRLGGCDVLVFSAGIGENVPEFRKMICDQLREPLGVELDEELNNCRSVERVISKPTSKVKVILIPTDEEVMIARDTVDILNLK